jgi:predicted mannosyl-3-phosphoglycerate phosphatase (HAD superfamily)
LNETSSDKSSNIGNAVKVNNDQTNQVGNQSSHDSKANEEILDEKIATNGPVILDKENLTYVDLKTRLTSNYFCFECGAVLTTIEDKKQHELFEIERKNRNDLENGD